ncbi:SDR family oxidoreductase [Actinokineospora sp. NBRC 105648]|uniref:SDR family oxidoreductase n=1 Tax=Actinokineospora sp. NBRC 105648 TaxID=3032206 RepID=UPI0024A31823|nr:SDR family oxidoreductase [Actinokineospora sp. NBRC 105648]GLZ37127.1 NAD(P)-dependent oxidoreductase [Actinokineospora sp. NBRC 105648]
MILVIGGTGTTGKALLHRLVALGVPARALVRPGSPNRAPVDGIDYVLGDAADPTSLRGAMTGVEQLFLAMGNGPRQQDIELGITAAAAAAGVEHIVKVSAPVVGPDVPVAISRTHFAVEQAIEASGVPHTFLRPYAFMQNLLNHAATIRATGVFFGATGDSPVNMVDARDIADVAAVALTQPEHRGTPLVLTGPEAVSYPEVATRLSQAGRPVRYIDQSPDKLRGGLRRADLPDWLVEHILEIQALTVACPETPNSTVPDVTGHPHRRLDDFLREHATAFTPPRWTAPAPVGWLMTAVLGSRR